MKTNWRASALFALVLASGLYVPSAAALDRDVDAQGKPNGTVILFAADPQIHNLYGLGLGQMLPAADWISKVAIRPAELNILAPFVFEYLVGEGLKESTPSAAVLLGDMTNIGCTGEFETFSNSLRKTRMPGLPVLMVHGNHDSYLMGTVNSYIPDDAITDWKPTAMGTSSVPTDEGWWGNKIDISTAHARNWRDGCYQPTGVGLGEAGPMNKARWLAKYVQMLRSDGLVEASAAPTSAERDGSYPLSYTATPGSVLSKVDYQARGRWFPPKFGAVPSRSDFTVTYRSFLVQSADIGDVRLVLIDTSVCETARGGMKFRATNAGQNGCIGKPQFAVIKQFVQSTPAGRRLVLAGHFPLRELSAAEAAALKLIASERKNWVYVSAHTHDPMSLRSVSGGHELNVGSTTDWPMEVNVAWFQADGRKFPSPLISTITNSREERNLKYSRTSYVPYAEVCRHLPAASKLASLDLTKPILEWKSPKGPSCTVTNEAQWKAASLELLKYLQRIRQRFDADPAYRSKVLDIAAAASEAESRSPQILDLIP